MSEANSPQYRLMQDCGSQGDENATVSQNEASHILKTSNQVDDVSGTILKLELTNFMCHASLVLEFNPKINFIVGKNGSGKSAIMTAIMVVLGSKASDTSRGKSLSNFVKVGANQARVRVTLSNKGLYSYKPDKYGHKIILTRTICRGSGGKFNVQTVKGNSVCTRNELENIMRALQINLPNPFAILTQETMKTFLSSSKPSEMYRLVMEGTGLTNLVARLHGLMQEVKSIESNIVQLKKEQIKIKNEIEGCQQKQNILNEMKNKKVEMTTMEHEALWAQVIEEESCLSSLQEKLKNFLTQKAAKEKKLDELENNQKNLEAKIAEMTAQFEICKSTFETKSQEQKVMQNDLLAITQKKEGINSAITLKSQQESQIEGDKAVLKTGLLKMSKFSLEEEVQKRAKKKQEVDQKMEEVRSVEATLITIRAEINRLREEGYTINESSQQLRDQLKYIKDSLKKQRMELEATKKEASSLPPVYGLRMPRLLQEINESERKFSKRPLGPIGMYVKVKDQKWALAAESYLRSEFMCFFCNNDGDRQILNQIIRRVLGRNLTVVISRFIDKVFDVSAKKVYGGHLPTLMDMLDVENPAVMNYLIDTKNVEKTLLCPTLEEAMHIMCDQSRVPRNCKLVITQEGDQVLPAPLYRFYSSESSRVEFLSPSREFSIANMVQAVKEEEGKAEHLQSQINKTEELRKRNTEEIKKTHQHLKELENKESRLQEFIVANNNEEELNADNFESLELEYKECSAKIEALQSEKHELLEQRNELDRSREEKKGEMKNSAKLLAELKSEFKKHQEHKFNLDSDLSIEKQKLQFEKNKFSELCDRENTLREQLARQQQATSTVETRALEASPRINTSRSVAVVKKGIQDLKVYIETANSRIDKPETIQQMLTSLESSYEKISRTVSLLSPSSQELKTNMAARKSHYRMVMHSTLVHIGEYFTTLIGLQHFTGSLNFDKEKGTLSIDLVMTDTSSNRLKNLSGGERSYTTVALILSVWDKMNVPFFMMDEFDVFMDMINRRYISDALIAEAKAKKNKQFMFFTPQEMSLEASKIITIHKLEDPRKS